jgi:microcystin-dependent protein
MDPFVAEIRIFPFNFPPKGWAFCDGQLMPISQNTALFSLVGTYYGGDGKSNFALPDMQGRAPMHTGQGPGLSLYSLGESGGSETVTLLQTEMPIHSHSLLTNTVAGDTNGPSPNVSLARSHNANAYQTATSQVPSDNVSLAPGAIGPTGGNLPHNNMMPYLTLNFCIALQGIYPPRT